MLCLSKCRILTKILFGPEDFETEKELTILTTSTEVVGNKNKELMVSIPLNPTNPTKPV